MAATSHERLSPTIVKAGTEAPGSAGQLTVSLSGEWAAGLSDFSAVAPDAKLGKGSSSNLDATKAGKANKTLSAEHLADVEKSEATKDTLAVAHKLTATLSAEQVADVVHDVSKTAALAVVERLNLLGSLRTCSLAKQAALDTDKLNAKMSGSEADDPENDGSKGQAQAEKAEPCPVSELNANLSEDRVAEIKKVFESYDTEGNGAIPVSKLGAVMSSLGYKLTESNLQDILGTEKRTIITFSELITMIAKDVLAANTEEEFKQVFKVFDHNGDGLVSCAELRYAMTTLGQKLSSEDVDEMIRVIRKDAKGKLTFDEFVTVVTSK
ncbi:uncharacterized protein LOC142807415 [Rhipicephalus microplus]|uniref:uncharacterized protein LOC142807415 n=1 Tax=Rhipicephalus microplus TaxID=6941 RepID=UPI003F6D01C5